MSSSDIAISVRGLSKAYTIVHETKQSTLAETMLQRLRNPFQRPTRETFWALNDVSFDVKRGDVVGIIGRNGAGKSTLLKVLSRIVEPTKGEVELRGRVGSLLEVGTGFHPELTGRENIYLNGAILGMKRSEIKRQFDAIIDFAGIEQFLDMPAKRYSTGMYMRLAFAVAAHLNPEILVVDEVLAVGDLAFQKRCIGKMGEVAQQGRTILFVSHNMGALLSLCGKGVMIREGRVESCGAASEVVRTYLQAHTAATEEHGLFQRRGFDSMRDMIISAELLRQDGSRSAAFSSDETMELVLHTNPSLKARFGVEIRLKNSKQEFIGYVSSWIRHKGDHPPFAPGDTIRVRIPSLNLVQDEYYVDFICRVPLVYHVDNWWDSVRFTVTDCRPGKSPVAIQATDQLGSIVLREATWSTS